jgi:hypothetical protein
MKKTDWFIILRMDEFTFRIAVGIMMINKDDSHSLTMLFLLDTHIKPTYNRVENNKKPHETQKT